MLDINFIREHPEEVKKGVQKKNVDPQLVDDFLGVDEEWRRVSSELDEARSGQNELSEQLANGKDEVLLKQAKELKTKAAELEKQKDSLDAQRMEILNRLPNIPFEDVTVGEHEGENTSVREEGKKPEFDFEVKDYLTIAEELGVIDVKKSAKVSGSRFGYLLGDLVLMEFALVKFVFDTLIPEGFQPVVPPVMIKEKPYEGMGRLAADQKEERYYLEKDELYLVGSAEHTVGPYHMGDVLEEKSLPRRYAAFSTCFRREAGSYGQDTKGILRVHQFDKAEMFSFTHPEKSEEELQFLLSMQERMLQALELPYEVVEICTGDMGWTDARQYDLNTWFPSQGKYRETHSCSNTTDFQSRGINARYRTKEGKPDFVHMLNATGFAIGRTLIAIIENYQTKDGKVGVPKVLQEYMGKKEMG